MVLCALSHRLTDPPWSCRSVRAVEEPQVLLGEELELTLMRRDRDSLVAMPAKDYR